MGNLPKKISAERWEDDLAGVPHTHTHGLSKWLPFPMSLINLGAGAGPHGIGVFDIHGEGRSRKEQGGVWSYVSACSTAAIKSAARPLAWAASALWGRSGWFEPPGIIGRRAAEHLSLKHHLSPHLSCLGSTLWVTHQGQTGKNRLEKLRPALKLTERAGLKQIPLSFVNP